MYSWILTSFAAMTSKIIYIGYNSYYDSELNVLLYFTPMMIYFFLNLFCYNNFILDINGVIYCLFFSVNRIFILTNNFKFNKYFYGITTTNEILFTPLISNFFLDNLFNPQIFISILTISGGSFACCNNNIDYKILTQYDIENQYSYKNSNKFIIYFINTGASISCILENIFLAKYLYVNSNIIILLFYSNFFSLLSVSSYNYYLFYRRLIGELNFFEFNSYDSCINYTCFIMKFLFESMYVYLLSIAFVESPNIGYCKMIIAAYLPITRCILSNRINNFKGEFQLIAFYLYFIGIFFLTYLGRHLQEKNNIAIILNGTN